MSIFAGTSGYSHDDWKGNFYPEKFSQKKMLGFYAEHFTAVEINYTFRSIPGEQAVMSWAGQVPESFRFVLKAWQAITHFKRLQDAEQETDDFLSAVSILQERQGPSLFQLAPSFTKNVPRLDAFPRHIAGRAKCAFEFRHPSWLDDEVYNCLRAHSAVPCIVDGVELIRCADWGYLRLAGSNYTDADLRDLIQRIESNKWNESYVFFMHSDAGKAPQLATRFHELIGV